MAIAALSRSAYAKWVPRIGREPKPMTADYDLAVRRHRFDLLFIDGHLAALIETVAEGETLLIENLAVGPDYQRRGLGTMLMAHAESIAKSTGQNRLRLYTNARFEGNVALYERLGYRVDGQEDIAGGSLRVDMSKAV